MSELERRYRRLLAWYPRDHREQNSDEMLGVLLARAGDRSRPGWRDTGDLLWGAVRLHLRRVVAADGGINPRDVLAIVSLLGPVALLAGATTGLHELAWWVRAGGFWDMSWREQFPDAPLWCLWVVVAVLGMFRLRRSAVVGAWVGTAGFAVLAFYDAQREWVGFNAGWALLGAMTVVALTWSSGPARGLELVQRRGILIVAAGVATAVLLGVLGYREPRVSSLGLVALTIGAVTACGLHSRAGRRAALVLLLPVMTAVLAHFVGRVSTPTAATIFYGAPLVALFALGGLPRRPTPRTQ